jgi:hypothetical protein
MNVVDLTNKMTKLFEDIENDNVTKEKAVILNTTARTAIAMQKSQIDYAKAKKQNPDLHIAFMEM